MDAEAFNSYLKHDGVLDMLSSREENNLLESDAIEKYSKHVKAIFQVGDKKTNDWSTSLGYPIEFIPLSNPYDLSTGDTLQVKLLREGKPLANQIVYANYAPSVLGHSHDTDKESHTHDGDIEPHTHGDDITPHTHGNEKATHTHGDDKEPHTHNNDTNENEHTHVSGQQLRTNDSGIVNVSLNEDGIWYLRTIHLVTTEETGLTHESNWATLTFEVAHSHEHGKEDVHSHKDEEGIPSYVFWIASILVLGGLFLWFNRKK